jgi:hypothetical protein
MKTRNVGVSTTEKRRKTIGQRGRKDRRTHGRTSVFHHKQNMTRRARNAHVSTTEEEE